MTGNIINIKKSFFFSIKDMLGIYDPAAHAFTPDLNMASQTRDFHTLARCYKNVNASLLRER